MQIKCPLCGEKFNSEEELNRHLRQSHSKKVRLEKLEHPEHA
jgi:uncharacterized C2H2 Zn-finger protein